MLKFRQNKVAVFSIFNQMGWASLCLSVPVVELLSSDLRLNGMWDPDIEILLSYCSSVQRAEIQQFG
jgi:hypothetical protein